MGQNKHCVYLQVPGVGIVMDYWLVQHPPDQHTHQKVQEIHSFKLAFFSCPILPYFLRVTLSSFLPFVSHIRGHMARTPLACLRFSREKTPLRNRFPSLASLCVELVCIHATYQHHTHQSGCEALSAVNTYADAFVSGFDLGPNEHIPGT